MVEKITVPDKVKAVNQKDAQDVQEKIVIYQILQKRAEEINQQLLLLQNQFVEIETSKQGVSELKKVKKDNDILIPLGSGCFINGKVTDLSKLLVDIGAGVMTKKSTNEAISALEKKGADVERAMTQLQIEINSISAEMHKILPELQKAAQDAEKKVAGGG